MLISGYCSINGFSAGQSTALAACSPGNAQVARRAFSGVSQCSRGLLDLFQMRTEALNQSLARFGRHHAAGGAGQQPDIEPRFEMAHGMAERRLRHAKLGRRA